MSIKFGGKVFVIIALCLTFLSPLKFLRGCQSCIVLNSKDCEEAKFTEESKDVVIFVERVGEEDVLKKATQEFEEVLEGVSQKAEKKIFTL